MVGAVAANYLGLRTSGKVQLATSGLIIAVLLATVLMAIPSMHVGGLSIPSSGVALGRMGKGAMLIFWSFFGWEAIASLAPEFHYPGRDVMRATWGAVVIVGVLYFGIALAVVGTHSYALVICLGTTNAFVASISRLAYSLSHEKLAPVWFDHISEKRSTPQRAVLLVGVLAGIGLIITYAFHLSMNQLVYIPNSLGIATYVLGTAAGVRLIRWWVGKACAGIACALCLAAYPFVGAFIEIPLVVGVLCVRIAESCALVSESYPSNQIMSTLVPSEVELLLGRCGPTLEVSDELYETMVRRDTKFDGKLYIGIVSTGIVCFPSCRSRLPKRDNVRVYPSLEEALKAGFRPCKRCKPDHPERHSPDAEVVRRILEILNRSFHEALTLQSLAGEMSMSPYHLQRTFKRFMGISPTVELQRIRMDCAKELLGTTDNEIGDIALNVGYHSASHFSAVFRKECGLSPNDYRASLHTKS